MSQHPHDVAAGGVIFVTDGPTIVGYLHFASVRSPRKLMAAFQALSMCI